MWASEVAAFPPSESFFLIILCKADDVIVIGTYGRASHAPQQTHAEVHGDA